MTAGPARARRVRLPPGGWVRQHIIQLLTIGVILVLIVACCNPPAWPTLVWQVVAHNCGVVEVGVVYVASGATQAEACFAQAYRRCSAATLGASFVNLDYGASYKFVIEPYGFTCAVGALWNTSGRTPFSGSSGVGYCGSVRLEANGLRVLGCQSIGDVFVPADGRTGRRWTMPATRDAASGVPASSIRG